MQKESKKFSDSTVFEGMTSIRALIRAMDESISDRKIHTILYDLKKEDKNAKELGYLRAVSKKYGFAVQSVTQSEIDALALGTSHGGLLALCSARTVPPLSCESIRPDGFYCMIEGVEDPYNFGYALRSLYAVGCDGIVVPERNWLSAAGVVCRSSAGASELLPTFRSDAESAIELFHAMGYHVVCAEEKTEHTLGECDIPFPTLLLVGGEKRGVSRKILDACDLLVRIPYGREFRASLSCASATTIFGYEILRQRRLASTKEN